MFVPGEEPHWLSDGGGEVGVSTTHRSIIEKGIGGGIFYIWKTTHRNKVDFKKKIRKKIILF